MNDLPKKKILSLRPPPPPLSSPSLSLLPLPKFLNIYTYKYFEDKFDKFSCNEECCHLCSNYIPEQIIIYFYSKEVKNREDNYAVSLSVCVV